MFMEVTRETSGPKAPYFGQTATSPEKAILAAPDHLVSPDSRGIISPRNDSALQYFDS
jgi:hypothetical protein